MINATYFTRLFRATYQVPPGEYRRLATSQDHAFRSPPGSRG
jgi:AraC-like DNA-binding protein